MSVIPGVSSVHALTARHGIPLNRVAGAVLITTGRRLADHGFPAGVDDVVVMLDAGCAFKRVIDEPLEIYWGAYLGTRGRDPPLRTARRGRRRDRARPRGGP